MKFVCYKTSCKQVSEKNSIASVYFSDFIYPGVFKIVKLENNINVVSYNSEAFNDSDRNWLFQSFTLMKMSISTCENG